MPKYYYFYQSFKRQYFFRRKRHLSCVNLIIRIFSIQLIRIFFVQIIKRWFNILQICWIYEWHIMSWQFFNHKTCWACIDFDRRMFWTLDNFFLIILLLLYSYIQFLLTPSRLIGYWTFFPDCFLSIVSFTLGSLPSSCSGPSNAKNIQSLCRLR